METLTVENYRQCLKFSKLVKSERYDMFIDQEKPEYKHFDKLIRYLHRKPKSECWLMDPKRPNHNVISKICQDIMIERERKRNNKKLALELALKNASKIELENLRQQSANIQNKIKMLEAMEILRSLT